MQGRHLLSLCTWALLSLPIYAQSPNLASEERDMVRVTRHPDGAQAIYKRQAGQPGMLCMTYSASGKLAAINEYIEGKYGQLVGCVIYNGKRDVIYKVSYGYDQNARLIEERMFAHPSGELVQRVIYKYDAEGNRSKPVIISLNRNQNAQQISPTMHSEVQGMSRDKRAQ